MLEKLIRLWKIIIYTLYVGKCRSYCNLSQEAQRKEDIFRAVRDLNKATVAGKKALNILSEGHFPDDEAKAGLQDVLEAIEDHKNTLIGLSLRRN